MTTKISKLKDNACLWQKKNEFLFFFNFPIFGYCRYISLPDLWNGPSVHCFQGPFTYLRVITCKILWHHAGLNLNPGKSRIYGKIWYQASHLLVSRDDKLSCLEIRNFHQDFSLETTWYLRCIFCPTSEGQRIVLQRRRGICCNWRWVLTGSNRKQRMKVSDEILQTIDSFSTKRCLQRKLKPNVT